MADVSSSLALSRAIAALQRIKRKPDNMAGHPSPGHTADNTQPCDCPKCIAADVLNELPEYMEVKS